MSWSTPDEFMELWTMDSEESRFLIKKYFLDGLDYIVQAASNSLSRISKGAPTSHPEIRWFEEYGYPSYFTAQLTTTTGPTVHTLTFTGKLFGKDLTAENLAKCMRLGTIFEKENGGGQVQITDTTELQGSAPFSCEVEYFGNTTPADDTGAVTYVRIGEPVNDYTSWGQSRSLPRWTRRCGTQIFEDSFEIPRTRELTQFEIINDEPEHQIQRIVEKLHRDLSYTVLRGRNVYVDGSPVFGLQTETPTMCGLCTWPEIMQAEQANPTVYVDGSSTELSRPLIDNLLRNLWLTEHADYDQGDWAIVCHPDQHYLISGFDEIVRRETQDSQRAGWIVTEFQSKTIGRPFEVLADRYMRPDVLMVVDFSKVSYGFYSGDEFFRKEVFTDNRVRKWLLSFQAYGVVVRKMRSSLGMIYGLPQITE